MTTFAEKVRRRLAEMARTQSDLAAAVGTTSPQVSAWLNRGVTPSTESAVKIAKYLGLSLDYLLDDAQDEPQAQPSPLARQMFAALSGIAKANSIDLTTVILRLAQEMGGPPAETLLDLRRERERSRIASYVNGEIRHYEFRIKHTRESIKQYREFVAERERELADAERYTEALKRWRERLASPDVRLTRAELKELRALLRMPDRREIQDSDQSNSSNDPE